VVLPMTKISITAESSTPADLVLKALVVLPETAVIAFHTEEGLLYITDAYAAAALAYLIQAGISAQVAATEGG
jgi:hypothetical protein